jgi:poly(hydroxyalkanoate) granule-associated protein
MSQVQTSMNSQFAAAQAGRDLLAAGRNLWLAGLGAVAGAEKETRGLFGRLVERGRPLEERRKRAAGAVSERTGQTVREMGKLLQETVEYEGRQVLKRMGFATRDDFKVLSARLDVLAKSIDELVARWRVEESLAAAQPTTETTNKTAAGTPRKSVRRTAKKETR